MNECTQSLNLKGLGRSYLSVSVTLFVAEKCLRPIQIPPIVSQRLLHRITKISAAVPSLSLSFPRPHCKSAGANEEHSFKVGPNSFYRESILCGLFLVWESGCEIDSLL